MSDPRPDHGPAIPLAAIGFLAAVTVALLLLATGRVALGESADDGSRLSADLDWLGSGGLWLAGLMPIAVVAVSMAANRLSVAVLTGSLMPLVDAGPIAALWLL